jgi:hypothetical protein
MVSPVTETKESAGGVDRESVTHMREEEAAFTENSTSTDIARVVFAGRGCVVHYFLAPAADSMCAQTTGR